MGVMDLESRTHDIAIIQGEKFFDREFMCEMPKGVNQCVRWSGAGHEGAGGWG